MSGGICFAPLYGQVAVNDMSWEGLKFPGSCLKMYGLSWDLLLVWYVLPLLCTRPLVTPPSCPFLPLPRPQATVDAFVTMDQFSFASISCAFIFLAIFFHST